MEMKFGITKSTDTCLKFGISERFLSSKVELRRLDCIGSCGANTKYQQIFLRTYMQIVRVAKKKGEERIHGKDPLPVSTGLDLL